MSIDIALAASAREWPDRLHRHILDHGGARVVGRIMGTGEASEVVYDVMLIDDICSFLSPRLVATLREAGRELIGVYAPDDGPDAKRHLLECGIGDVIESDAPAEEFLDRVASLVDNRAPIAPDTSTARSGEGLTIGVIGSSVGVGMTEIAIGLTSALSDDTDALLVDLDPGGASVAQRLGLAPHPNIRSAVDSALFRRDEPLPTQQFGEFEVIAGLAPGDMGPPVPHPELNMLLDDAETDSSVVVADLGAFVHAVRGVFRRFDCLILVGLGDPVGIGRMIKTREALSEVVETGQIICVANRVPPRPYYRSEISIVLEERLDGDPWALVPDDPRLVAAAWDGLVPGRGPFRKAMQVIARPVLERIRVDH